MAQGHSKETKLLVVRYGKNSSLHSLSQLWLWAGESLANNRITIRDGAQRGAAYWLCNTLKEMIHPRSRLYSEASALLLFWPGQRRSRPAIRAMLSKTRRSWERRYGQK